MQQQVKAPCQSETLRGSLLYVTAAFFVFSIVTVYWATVDYSFSREHDELFFFRKHLFRLFMGFLCMVIASKLDFRLLKKYAPHLLVFSLILLTLMIMPGLGFYRYGVKRWLNFLPYIVFNPSELFKLAFVIFLARALSGNKITIKIHAKLITILALSSAILFSQPDIGAFLVLFLTFITLFFISGAQKKQALLYVAVPLVMLSVVLLHQYAVSSLSARLNARSFLQNVNTQKIENARINGALLMAGRGEIYQKDSPHAHKGYLPEVQYDYTVLILRKEFGIIGAGLLCLLFMILLYQGVVIYRQLPDADVFARFLCAGILSLLFYQAAVNILCAAYILPNVSTYFPFISPFDASSVVFAFIEMGILIGFKGYYEYGKTVGQT